MSTQRNKKGEFELITFTSLGVVHSQLNYFSETITNVTLQIHKLNYKNPIPNMAIHIIQLAYRSSIISFQILYFLGIRTLVDTNCLLLVIELLKHYWWCRSIYVSVVQLHAATFQFVIVLVTHQELRPDQATMNA